MDFKDSFNIQNINVQYKILILNDRLLFVKIDDWYAPSGLWSIFAYGFGVFGIFYFFILGAELFGIAGAVILPLIGIGLGILFGRLLANKHKIEIQQKIDRLSDMSYSDILRADKKNFVIPYAEITSIQMTKPSIFKRTGLSIEAKSDFRFYSDDKRSIQECERLVAIVNNLRSSV
jgi:hypothetical protein